MIKTETTEKFVRHYSDSGFKIRQIETGIVYDEAVDVIPCRYTYGETNESIEADDLTAEEALDIITGGTI